MKNLILNANKGLVSKFDSSKVKFKKTFAKAKKLGVNLTDTNQMFKGTFSDGSKGIFKISFVNGYYSKSGRYFEDVTVLPYLKLK